MEIQCIQSASCSALDTASVTTWLPEQTRTHFLQKRDWHEVDVVQVILLLLVSYGMQLIQGLSDLCPSTAVVVTEKTCSRRKRR